MGISESDDDHLSPMARFQQSHGVQEPSTEATYESASPVSSRSGLSTISKSSGGSRTPGRYPGSMRSQGMTENTYISAGSSLQTSTIGRREVDTYSMGYSLGSTSMASSKSRHRPSRLRNEIPRSPDDNRVHDLFKYTRTRLSDIPYKRPIAADNSRLMNDDLRRQMLYTIFGWHQDVEDLIRDEMSRHPAGSASRILLAKWLGDIEIDILTASSENMSSSDWMLLALSGIGGQASQHKLGRAYVQRLLESGDVHVAVTIMLGMGDHNDAIEVYSSHKRYMEALILTCLAYPSVWERQAAIIRKWGEWAVQHGQQPLAIRCFACTDQESSEPWSSPSAAQLHFQALTPSIPEVLSPPLSPPGVQRGPQRSIAKTSALKLITSFGDPSQKSKFYSQGDGGQTPLAAGPTPIAESAVSPGASHDATTAFLRPSNNSRFNTPTSARPTNSRGRLPSIGESGADQIRQALRSRKQSVGEASQPEPQRQGHTRTYSQEKDTLAVGNSLQRAATASPMMVRDKIRKENRHAEHERPPSPNREMMTKLQQARSDRRNGSRDRIPLGVNLKIKPMETKDIPEVTSPDQSIDSSTRYHWPTRRRGAGSVASSVTSTSSAGRGLRGQTRHRDDYINSLDAAQHYSKRARSRHGSKERTRDTSRSRHTSRERKPRSREASEERGRASSRMWAKPKRSPTSPIPMSPEDLAILSTPRFSERGEPLTVRKVTDPKAKPSSRASSRSGRRRSPDGRPRPPALDIRGRSQSRGGSQIRSPSSPLPLSATTPHYHGSEDEEDYQRAMQEREIFRAKHSKSAGHSLNSPTTTRRERSESRRREAFEVVDTLKPLAFHGRAASTEHAGDLRKMKDERQRKKELAARELEERRRSLAKRPQAPVIPHPDQFSPRFPRIGIEATEEQAPENYPIRSATAPPRSLQARGGQTIGLPATPKAMRLMFEAEQHSQASPALPSVPSIPASFAQRSSPKFAPRRSPEIEDDHQLVTEAEREPEILLPTLTLLPSTVYQPPMRPMIPRSMSAPIPDEPSAKRYARKGSTVEMPGIDEVVQNQRRRSQEDQLPPPPPPAPPMLRELQHLAKPPPPPPAPLPHARRPSAGGALSSGMIEIVMDDDDEESGPMIAVPNDYMVPVIPPPAPRSAKGHNRGRSQGDGSISGKFSKATERLRSASRGKKEATRIRSPPIEAPYESIPMPSHLLRSPIQTVPPPVSYDQDAVRSPVDAKGKHLSTGLHRSEMF